MVRVNSITAWVQSSNHECLLVRDSGGVVEKNPVCRDANVIATAEPTLITFTRWRF